MAHIPVVWATPDDRAVRRRPTPSIRASVRTSPSDGPRALPLAIPRPEAGKGVCGEVASYLCQVQTIQRAAGRSAVAAAAYRSGQSLTDERLAMEFDFAAKEGIELAEILAPADAPAAFQNRETLWNAAEKSEQRKDAVPARELLLALPHELTFEQRRALVREFVAEHIVARGMIADIAFHKPGQEGDQRNFHAHILMTTRRVGPEGFGLKEPAWRTPQQVRDWREAWAEIQNRDLRRHLGPNAPQVSHLSLAEQGVDRVPGEHLGPAATALERRNKRTQKGERNRDVEVRNQAADQSRHDYADTADRIAAKTQRIEAPIGQLVAEAARVRDELMAQRDAWKAEHGALSSPRVRSAAQTEREILAEDLAARAEAGRRLQRTEARVAGVRGKRLQLVAWIRNPARMIWAKHAELNALARARAEARRRELWVEFRQAWLRSEPGQAVIAARRQPGLEAAAETAKTRRTLVRKIKRIDRRIEAAGQTYDALRVAEALGQRQLRVPAQSPDATRFIRDVGEPARAALARYPIQAQQQAIERLNRGRGRDVTRSLFPGL